MGPFAFGVKIGMRIVSSEKARLAEAIPITHIGSSKHATAGDGPVGGVLSFGKDSW